MKQVVTIENLDISFKDDFQLDVSDQVNLTAQHREKSEDTPYTPTPYPLQQVMSAELKEEFLFDTDNEADFIEK